MDLAVPYDKMDSAESAFQAALKEITPEYVAKWKIKADISNDPGKKRITATGKGFELNITFTDSQAEVDISLSFLLKAAKGKVLSEVEKKLQRHM